MQETWNPTKKPNITVIGVLYIGDRDGVETKLEEILVERFLFN